MQLFCQFILLHCYKVIALSPFYNKAEYKEQNENPNIRWFTSEHAFKNERLNSK